MGLHFISFFRIKLLYENKFMKMTIIGKNRLIFEGVAITNIMCKRLVLNGRNVGFSENFGEIMIKFHKNLKTNTAAVWYK